MTNIKIPSKTFLCGEYVALNGGPALLLNTPPEFEFTIGNSLNDNKLTLHPGSPCYKFYNENKDLFSGISFHFNDPHNNKGGFGASGAKFNSLVAVKKILSRQPLFNSLDFRKKLLFYSEQSQSGYDVISQFNGKVCYININKKKIERLEWGFEDIDITIVRTGNKLNTHEHLSQLKVDKYTELEQTSYDAYNSFVNKNYESFCDSINLYYNLMIKKNLICKESISLTSKIKSETNWYSVVKACGAAGSDTVLLLHHKSITPKSNDYLKSLGLEIVSCGQQLSSGMSIQGDLVNEKSEVEGV